MTQDPASNLIPAQTTVYNGIGGHSVMMPSGYHGSNWPIYSGTVVPAGLSAAGWTIDSQTYERGFEQQTFLGASIRSFSMNGGFGDSSSTLTVDLVNDEFNHSDNTGQGSGDDPYHSGQYGDRFVPPIAGTPVYFKFGPNKATIEEAYRKTYDDLYGYTTSQPIVYANNGSFNKDSFTSLPANNLVDLDSNTYRILNLNTYSRGREHIVFGGILQSYVQNRGFGGNPIYSVQVTDPREILSNVVLILNNYAGTTFNSHNVINIYGFLEHNMTPALSGSLQDIYRDYNLLKKYYSGNDGRFVYGGTLSPTNQLPLDCWTRNGMFAAFGGPQTSDSFPVTGTGFSRRGPQGMPFYRVKQAINSLMQLYRELPDEYEQAGYGGLINFRGHYYVLDFGSLPDLPFMYFLDFDQINLLDLALEICDITSRDLFVSLLPIINHPACSFLYSQNQNRANKYISGIIRLDAIDRSRPPSYGAIKQYIDNLVDSGLNVENQDVGYELSNVTTNKFVVGAQEVDMYYFSANADRGMIDARNRVNNDMNQWLLEKQLEQQILPYYGLLGNTAVTIPKGWGAYQQIMLDTTGLNANGVGAYYVTTEMELRAASVSYDNWKEFLKQYNDTYIESIEGDDSYEGALLNQTASFGNIPAAPNISNDYGVTVPRSVFPSHAINPFGEDNLPSSPCNPPYGYPLYYKRMTKLGIPEGGLTTLQSRITGLINAGATIRGADGENYEEIRNNQLAQLEEVDYGTLTNEEKAYYDAIKQALRSTPPNVAMLNDLDMSLHSINATLPRLQKKGTENALKVYNFLKKIADENLGKKFLVKLPNKVNLNYDYQISAGANNEYIKGPFGFKPRPAANATAGYEFSQTFISTYQGTGGSSDMMNKFLKLAPDTSQNIYVGAMRANYNPISEKHEFNYTPMSQGGYFPFELYSTTLTSSQVAALTGDAIPKGVNQLLIPQDLTNFLDENGRVSAYARFDYSQHLSFEAMDSADFTQQLITSAGMVPDLCEFLANVGEDKWETFNDADSNRPDNLANASNQCAFVKCSVDEKIYMPPKILESTFTVYGQSTNRPKVVKPKKIFIPCSGLSNGYLVPGTGVYVNSFRYTEQLFYPTTQTAGSINRYGFDVYQDNVLNSWIINTSMENLDTSNTYALITLPNKILPTKDARFRDANNQKYASVHHHLTVDVVKGLPEFNNVAMRKLSGASTRNLINTGLFSAEARSSAWLASKAAQSDLQYGLANRLKVTAPSPVYPDLVALPLMSHDRCYGPWVSSQIDPTGSAYTNIGGRVEFTKDENLSPWNYAGYDLMNEAGKLQASFSNSLFLFSERGGFTAPGLPKTSLCQLLVAGGPLVTNISVDVSDGGLKTTYKMDMYTASFGKLQKQKADLISKISRERQRLRDERNALIRKGIGKMQASASIVGAVNLLGNNGTPLSISMPPLQNNIVASVATYETKSFSPQLNTYSSSASPSEVAGTDYVHAASMQTDQDLYETTNSFDSELDRNRASYNAGSINLSDKYAPFSYEPHANMPYIQPQRDKATFLRQYEKEDEPERNINDDDVSTFGGLG